MTGGFILYQFTVCAYARLGTADKAPVMLNAIAGCFAAILANTWLGAGDLNKIVPCHNTLLRTAGGAEFRAQAGGIFPIMVGNIALCSAQNTGFYGKTSIVRPYMLKGSTFRLFAKRAVFWGITACALPIMLKGGAACDAAKRANLGRITGSLIPIMLAFAAAHKS